MRRSPARLVTTLALCSLFAAACGGSADSEDAVAESADAAGATRGDAAATPAPTADASMTAEASMTADDIDRWARGMTAELAAVKEAGQQFKSAKTATDSMNAMMAANETSTRAAGARAAGLDESRYGIVRTTLSSIVRYIAPLDADMDVSKLPAEMRASLQKDRDETLARMAPTFPPAVIEALRPRAAELRRQEMALTGERLRAAGMVP